VIGELIDPAVPHGVRAWASSLRHWIDVREAVISNDDMTHLDPGERAAIVLAQSEPDALLLIDETAGRIEASRRIRNTGTLGVLRAGALKDYLDFSTALGRLLETKFRVSTELVSALLAEDAERRRRTEPTGDLVPTARHPGRQRWCKRPLAP
jgi:predicted nucleic acid-binding protein